MPDVERHGDNFHISYVDYNSPIHIKSGADAHNLLKSVGYDNLRAIGFDGLKMKRDGGQTWAIVHSPDFNIKSATGNTGEFNNISNKLHESK